MKKYPVYKDSGIEWLGEIPESWDSVKLKRLTQFLYGESLSDENRFKGSVPVYGSNGIVGCHSKAITKTPCIIIGRKGSFGKINYSENKCFPIDTTFYIDSTASHNHIRWLYYLLLILNLDFFSKDSAVPGLSREEAYEKVVLFPSIQEQQAIATYLDRKTSQIDTLIEKKQRLIELLKEYRTAIINHAVTKGLNPDVKMKDSGIEWIGEIPEHWKIKPLKFLVQKNRIIRGPFGSTLKIEFFVDNGYKVYEQKNAIYKDVTLGHYYIDENKYTELIRFAVKEDDLIISCSGTVGRIFRIPSKFLPGVINQALLKITLGKNVFITYFVYLFESDIYQYLILDKTQGGAMKNLVGIDNFKALKFITPLLYEQQSIATYLDRKTSQIDTLIEKQDHFINLLKEERTALISEAVTGKIDIREFMEDEPKVNPYFIRAVLSAEIISQQYNIPTYDKPTLGRVKLQKVLYLCEHAENIPELETNYHRYAAGPFDGEIMNFIKSQIEDKKWFKEVKDGLRYKYSPMENVNKYKKYYQKYWGSFDNTIQKIINLTKPLDTDQCEIIATLFAAWNDLIIQDITYDDNRIIDEVQNNWHKDKHIPSERCINALKWMRDKNLIPKGYGKLTKSSNGI